MKNKGEMDRVLSANGDGGTTGGGKQEEREEDGEKRGSWRRAAVGKEER